MLVYFTILIGLVTCDISNIQTVNSLDDVLGNDYIALNPRMCFKYETKMGAYLQTIDMFKQTSKFVTTLDITNITQGAVAQFTIHRNSYTSLDARKSKFAISLTYDRKLSDDYISTNSLDLQNDILVQLDLIGSDGSIKSQGTVMNVTKSKIQISVDLSTPESAKVMVDQTPFLDLSNMEEGSRKSQFLKMLNSNSQLDNFVSFAFFFDQDTKDAPKTSNLGV